jgi:hypothetical protein
MLDREEYIEQAYFFRVLRDRMAENLSTQEVLSHIDQEILSTTRLPYAIQFLATELKHTGCLSSGFARLSHYFTAFQTFIMQQTEDDRRRFSMETALVVLEREAQYRAAQVTPAGLFVYQFETVSRNRLGYDQGMASIESDPFYDAGWREFLQMVHRQVGVVDFADLVYVRSQLYVLDQRRLDPGYEPPLPPLFGEKEGKIAKANHCRDPLYLFAALQRQLGYPEVPRPRSRDDLASKFETLQARFKQLEQRVKLVEGEVKGQVDLSQFAKPKMLERPEEEES